MKSMEEIIDLSTASRGIVHIGYVGTDTLENNLRKRGEGLC